MKAEPKKNDLRGAATVEALLALSVFLIVWVGVLYMGSTYEARLQTEAEARKCAWLISAGACRRSVDGCASAVGPGGSEGEDLEETNDELFGDEGTMGIIGELLGTQLDDLFGRRAHAASSREVARPAALGGESVTVSSGYSLPCNTVPTDVGTLAEDLFRLFLPEGDGS